MSDADWRLYKRLRGKDLPQFVELRMGRYELERLFKLDFFAATGVYRRVGSGRSTAAANNRPAPRVVVKVYHTDPFRLLPLGWLGRWLCRRETAFHAALAGVEGVPRLIERYGESGFVRAYIAGSNLREHGKPDARFFPRLGVLLAEFRRRGIAHNDLNKPENVLVQRDGRPAVIDFQIAFRHRVRIPLLDSLADRLLCYLQDMDRYHVRKLHRRARPEDLSPEQLKASYRTGSLLALHRRVAGPYRAVRRFVLRKFLLAETFKPPRQAPRRAA